MPRDRWDRATTPVVRRVLSLWPDSLVVAAVKAGGGPELWMEAITEPFEILCGALRDEAQLHGRGIVRARRRLVDALSARGRARYRFDRQPELDTVTVAGPVIVCGLPGTGADELARGLARQPGWTRPDDEDRLMDVHLASMSFEFDWHVPAYAEWYDEADLTPAYGWLKRSLQLRQVDQGDRDRAATTRWVLSSMAHLEQLPAIRATFPDALVVHTRTGDLDAPVATLTDEVVARRRRGSSAVDPTQIRRYWTWRTERMLERHAVQATTTGPVMDVDAADLLAEPERVVERVVAHVEAPPPP